MLNWRVRVWSEKKAGDGDDDDDDVRSTANNVEPSYTKACSSSFRTDATFSPTPDHTPPTHPTTHKHTLSLCLITSIYAPSQANLEKLAGYCSEFLVHGVDVEGKQAGIMDDLVEALGLWSPIPVTYCGGARALGDVKRVYELGRGRVDLTIGSALDIFGGKLAIKDVVDFVNTELR